MAEKPCLKSPQLPPPSSAHSFTPLVAMRKSKEFAAQGAFSSGSGGLAGPAQPLTAGILSTARPDFQNATSGFLGTGNPAPPPPRGPQPIKATSQYLPSFPQRTSKIVTHDEEGNVEETVYVARTRTHSAFGAKSPESQYSSSSNFEDLQARSPRLAKDQRRSFSSARRSQEMRPLSAKSPALSSADSGAETKKKGKKRGAGTPHFPYGFMTTSIGDFKKSSGSDSDERGVLSKKDAEEVNLLSSESDEEVKKEEKARPHRHSLNAESLRLNNSKKPKKTAGAYKVFLRKNIYRKTPNRGDLQSLQRVIDSMETSTAIYAHNQAKNDDAKDQKSRKSPDPHELTQSRVEANLETLISDDEEKSLEGKRKVGRARFTFEQSKALMITAKNGAILNIQQLQSLLVQQGAVQHIDTTHLNKGKALFYFGDIQGAERAFQFMSNDPIMSQLVSVDKVNHSYQPPFDIPKTSSAPVSDPLPFYFQQEQHHSPPSINSSTMTPRKPMGTSFYPMHRRSDTDTSQEILEPEGPPRFYHPQPTMMRPGMPFQVYPAPPPLNRSGKVQMTPSTAPTDSSLNESTRFDMNNSCRITYLNNSAMEQLAYRSNHANENMSPYPIHPTHMHTLSSEGRSSFPMQEFVYWTPYQAGGDSSISPQQHPYSTAGNSFNNTMWTGVGARSWVSAGDDVFDQTWPGGQGMAYFTHPSLPLNASAQPFHSTQGSSHSSFLPQLSPLQPTKEGSEAAEKASPGQLWATMEVRGSPAKVKHELEAKKSKQRVRKKQSKLECSRTLFDMAIDTKAALDSSMQSSGKLELEELKEGMEGNEADGEEEQQMEERKEQRKKGDDPQFVLDIEQIKGGHDRRTTLMIRNIPNKYDQKLLLKTFDPEFKNMYDFFYLPIDFKNKCNVGYAFINFIDPLDIPRFYFHFHQQRWAHYNSEKVDFPLNNQICDIKYARIQGCEALREHFKSSSVMQQPDRGVRPLFGLDREQQRRKPKKRGGPRFWKEGGRAQSEWRYKGE